MDVRVATLPVMAVHQVNVSIDRTSPVPLYHQLSEQLCAAIADGRLQPGDPFENEVALAQRLSLSRPTVRRAIQEMVDKGLLVGRDDQAARQQVRVLLAGNICRCTGYQLIVDAVIQAAREVGGR